MNVHEKLYIGGEWVDPATDDRIDVISPHTEEVIGRVPEASTADVDRAVAAARDDVRRRRVAAALARGAHRRGRSSSPTLYAARLRDMADDHHRGDGLADHVLATSARRPRRG